MQHVSAVILQTQLEHSPLTIPASSAEPIIVVEDLRKSIRNGPRTVDILRGIDFSVPRGEFVAIMGASGSGKSTLLGLLAGLDTPSSGNVVVQGLFFSVLLVVFLLLLC